MDGTALQQVARARAEELPAAKMTLPFGPDYDVAKVLGKMFLLLTEVKGTPVAVVKAEPRDAEALRGAVLSLEIDLEEEAEEDPDAWYPSDLKGLAVRHVDGRELGTVLDLELHPAQDLLIVRGLDGRRVMLPFVEALVPEVDVEGGIVLADPPGGLFEDLPQDDDEDEDATESPAEGV